MAKFVPGQPITTDQPFIDVDAGLSVGTHRFQLVVVDAQGNRSAPDIQTVTVARIPITPPVVGPVGPVIPVDPVGPTGPVIPINPTTPISPVAPPPIQPIGAIAPTPIRPVRRPKEITKPQGTKRPRRGGRQ
jgi:hypothetical protein